jgi:predicted  nucleic acid-binding Zn-ribbon protein
MSDLDQLYRLQELDRTRDQLEKKKAAMTDNPDGAAVAQRLEQMNDALKKEKDALQLATKSMHRKELDLKEMTLRQQDIQRKLYDGSVTNVKEMEKMTQMVEEIQGTVNKLENTIIGLMMDSEEMEEHIRHLTAEVTEVSAEYESMFASSREAIMKVETELAAIPLEREAIMATIPPALLARYEHTRSRLGGVAMAKVGKDHVCRGCRVGVSMILIQAIRKGDQPVQCESCGRILVWDRE